MTVPIEFYLENLKISQQLEDKIRSHFEDWTDGHHDITNIYLSLKQVSGKKSVHDCEAKVVLYHRPDHIIVKHRAPGIPEALTAVVHAAERKLRDTRKQYKDRRKRARVDSEED